MASYEQSNYEDAYQDRKIHFRTLAKIILLGFLYFLGFHGLATIIALVWGVRVLLRSVRNGRASSLTDAEQHTDFLMRQGN